MDIELHFCERGSDYSFDVKLAPTATVGELWTQITRETLIPFRSFVIVGSDDKLIHLSQQPLSKKLSQLPTLQDDAILTYYDARFEPITAQELEFARTLKADSNVGEASISRPPLFQHILSKFPNIYERLQPPLSLLYVPNERKQMPLRSIEFLALLSQLSCAPEHRKMFWDHWVEKKNAFLKEGGVLVDNLKKDSDDDNQHTKPAADTTVKFEVFSTATEKVAQNELRYIQGLEQIRAAHEYANEYTPEIYGDVTMLYVPIAINDHKVACFLDSGAQITLISYEFACRVGIDHLIDRTFSGRAAGVGSGNILGLIHAIKVKLGSEYVSLAFRVVDSIKLDVLLGLDNFKRYKMKLNMESNCLEFNNAQIPFLTEGEMNDFTRERIKAKLERNETLGLKRDHGFDPADKAMLAKMEGKGKKVGSVGTTLESMISFMIANRTAIAEALTPLQDAHEYKMVQLQSSTPNGERPDARLRSALRAPNVVAVSPNMMNDMAARSPEELAQALQFLSQLQSAAGDTGHPLSQMSPEQLQALVQQLAGSRGVVGGAPQDQGRPVPDPAKLQSLVDMGFNRSLAANALSMYDNDLDMALLQLQGELDDEMKDE